ncbi:MAG: helix-turn-helix domain-containing protein [Filomicrobium sp.]
MTAAANESPRYLTNEEAAARLRISPKTLDRMRVEGTGPRFRKAGPGLRARVIYDVRDLDDWLEKYSYTAVAEYSSQDNA